MAGQEEELRRKINSIGMGTALAANPAS